MPMDKCIFRFYGKQVQQLMQLRGLPTVYLLKLCNSAVLSTGVGISHAASAQRHVLMSHPYNVINELSPNEAR